MNGLRTEGETFKNTSRDLSFDSQVTLCLDLSSANNRINRLFQLKGPLTAAANGLRDVQAQKENVAPHTQASL